MSNDKITCTGCSKPLDPAWEFCPFCGSGKAEPSLEPVEIETDDWPAETSGSPPARPQPIQLRSQSPKDVPHAIMLLNEGEIDIPALGRGLSKILQIPLAEITCRMRNTKGIIARDVPPEKLSEIADLTEELAIEIVAVPEDELFVLPPICRTPEIRTGANKLRAKVTIDSEQWASVVIQPADVRLVVTGRVMFTIQRRVVREKFDPYAGNPLLRKRYVKEDNAREEVAKEFHGHEYIIYLFLDNPVRLLQIDDRRIDEATLQRDIGRPDQMQQQARLLLRTLSPRLADSTLHLLADLNTGDPRWETHTFATERGLQAFAHWRYNRYLIDYGR